MAFDPVSAVLDIGGRLIDRLWPDPTQRAAAKLELLKLQKSGQLAEMIAQTDINKVGDIAKAQPVNQIADDATKNQTESRLAEHVIQIGETAVKIEDIEKQDSNRYHGNYSQGK